MAATLKQLFVSPVRDLSLCPPKIPQTKTGGAKTALMFGTACRSI
uniref:Uncharacterized protein n=1 Tax=Tetraselmis sp. GSL018 TaxID=582737 RepID=A0A061QMU7_9CHLO